MDSSTDELSAQTAAAVRAALAASDAHIEPVQQVGTAPDLEDLIALAENRVDDTRRAQLLAYIADDKELYAQWISVLEAQSVLERAASESVAAQASESRAGWFRIFAPFSGAIAAVGAVMLLVWPSENFDRDPFALNELYQQYTPQTAALATQLEFGKTRSASAHLQSAQQLALFNGLRYGSEQLRYIEKAWPLSDESAVSSTLPRDQNEISEDYGQQLVAAGRLAALAYPHCMKSTNNQDSQFFADSALVLQPLLRALDAHNDAVAAQLLSARELEGNKNQVCKFSRDVVTELQRK